MRDIMNQQKVVLFMKGDRVTPRCGFSRKIVALLESQNVTDFATFDILKDEKVRQGECCGLRFCFGVPMTVGIHIRRFEDA
jgi:glutaredoxin-related protein